MEHKFYDKWEFKQAVHMIRHNPSKAKIMIEEYQRKYPNDYSMKTYYASCLITLGEFDRAEKILDDLEIEINQDKSFRNMDDKMSHMEDEFIFCRLRILCYRKEYQKIYEFYKKNYNKIKEASFNEIIYITKVNLGIISPVRDNVQSYLYRQILDYQESDFLDHLNRHLADYNAPLDERNPVIFSSDFPTEKILEEVKKFIPSDKRIYSGFFQEKYVFKYDNCGKRHKQNTDYFEVIVFSGTTNIITMYPAADADQLPSHDLNYLRVNTVDNNFKRESQIDKFNRRFNRK